MTVVKIKAKSLIGLPRNYKYNTKTHNSILGESMKTEEENFNLLYRELEELAEHSGIMYETARDLKPVELTSNQEGCDMKSKLEKIKSDHIRIKEKVEDVTIRLRGEIVEINQIKERINRRKIKLIGEEAILQREAVSIRNIETELSKCRNDEESLALNIILRSAARFSGKDAQDFLHECGGNLEEACIHLKMGNYSLYMYGVYEVLRSFPGNEEYDFARRQVRDMFKDEFREYNNIRRKIKSLEKQIRGASDIKSNLDDRANMIRRALLLCQQRIKGLDIILGVDYESLLKMILSNDAKTALLCEQTERDGVESILSQAEQSLGTVENIRDKVISIYKESERIGINVNESLSFFRLNQDNNNSLERENFDDYINTCIFKGS